MTDKQSRSLDRVPLTLSESALTAGIIEMYTEGNTVAAKIICDSNTFFQRVTISPGPWESFVRSVTKNVKILLIAKKVSESVFSEIEFQIIKTLNENYILFTEFVNEEPSNEEGSDNNAQKLVLLASDPKNTECFFNTQYQEPYVAVRIGKDGHLETMPLQSKRYERYLVRLFYEIFGKITGADAINRALNLLAARTVFGDNIIPLNIRVAWGRSENRAKQGCIYYDMTDPSWSVVEICTKGWRMINGNAIDVPVLFKRYNQIAQIDPDKNFDPGIMEQFLNLTNVKNPNHRLLLKVYIISLLVPSIDHVILTTYGPKGAAKTFLLGLIKRLIDPSKPVLLTLLRDISEFIQQVNHNYLAFYDNVKYIPYWLSDEICKAVTGIGHTKRKLYTDDEDIVFEHRRCIAINGIDVALTEPDAMDRSLFIELPEIDYQSIKTQETLIREFQSIRPKLLGFLFDTLARAMKIKENLTLGQHSRMADFTEWGEAISRALGYEPMSFVRVYLENRNEQNIVAVNENSVGRIFVEFYKNYEQLHVDDPKFVGSPEELQKELVDYAESIEMKTDYRQFPHYSNILVKKLNAIKANLREGYGIIVQISRDANNNSVVSIFRTNAVPDGKNMSKINVVNNYYGFLVQRHHTKNFQNNMAPAYYNPEAASGTSGPPEQSPILRNNSGGTEVPEANSVIVTMGKLKTDNIKRTDGMSDLIIKEILHVVRENGIAQINLMAAVEVAYSRNIHVRNYLGGELNLRLNQKLRDVGLKIIHNDSIEVLSTRPDIILRWRDSK